MLNLELLDEVERNNDKAWWPLRHLESVLAAAKNLPCFQGNDEISMESFEYIDPILDVCLQKVKKALSQHEQVTDQIVKLRRLEVECQETSEPELIDAIGLLEQYSEHMKLERFDDINWQGKSDFFKSRIIQIYSTTSRQHEIVHFFRKLIEENHVRKVS